LWGGEKPVAWPATSRVRKSVGKEDEKRATKGRGKKSSTMSNLTQLAEANYQRWKKEALGKKITEETFDTASHLRGKARGGVGGAPRPEKWPKKKGNLKAFHSARVGRQKKKSRAIVKMQRRTGGAKGGESWTEGKVSLGETG